METVKALKEWAVTVQALARGRQVILLRKGGIHEKRFDTEYRSFFLYPTYEHQRRELIKPQFHADLEETLRDVPPPDTLTVSYWAEAAELYELREEEQVAALSPHFIWTEDYALRRLHWRPKQPLTLMLVRLYRLPRPVSLPVLPEYAGCFSWVDLPAEALSLEGATPVLSDAEFEDRARPVRESLKGLIPG